ncbi:MULTISPECIES: hypothetical protein [Aquimarina]|uniref:Uncharacterized protein n=1 Tax=Aquimarina algiphila TaxID=2047982 RepID=A0A554VI12_9FLAO|nr:MULTISPECIES: hypothetical protein [Aquimarina]TSE07266.1 hypothetical protein FOF46_16425 [Aquimarina algiphila]
MINEQKIPCPVCQGQIPFDITSLLQGVKFACPSCQSVVALSPESIDETRNAIEKYEELKQAGAKLKNKSYDKF